MPDDHEQIVVRRRKLDALRERGIGGYPNDFRPDHTTSEVHARIGGLADAELATAASVAVAGRIMAVRDFGKAGFLRLQDRGGVLQLHVRRDRLDADTFELYRLLDLGDLIGVRGRPFRTRTGELTLEVEELRLLAKALRPLPEKWHGLQDVETRYRQRYLDLIANPEARRIFEVRSRVIDHVRRFLRERGFLEVETPMMQGVAGGAAARPFVTHHNALDIDLYLRIAPELYLKRLVVGGFERVFELGRVFRNEGLSTEHNPEFTLLEFYQACATYEDLMDLTEQLLVSLAREVLGTLALQYRGHEIDLTPPWPRRTMVDLVAEHTKAPATRLLDGDTLRDLAAQHGIATDGSPGELLVRLFEHLVEPALVQPVFVCQFPVEVSPLARRDDRDPRFVDRFELYVARHEVANAFSELNDPADQRARFTEQLRQRAAGDEEAHAMDEDYVRALEYGMLPAAGEGIGIDRLIMLLTGAPSIREVILFPQLRPEILRMTWELLVGLRYLRSRRHAWVLSLISLLSLAGVTIGVATLDIVLGVMTGLERDLRDKILGFNPHIVVMSYGGAVGTDGQAVEAVRHVPDVVAAAPFVYGQAMLAVGRSASGIVVRGIDPAAAGDVVDVERHLASGSLAALATAHTVTLGPDEGGGRVELPGILIGTELARQLGIAAGDVASVISPLGTPGPTGLVPRIKRFVVAGVFDSGMFDYDATLAYMALADAQRFFDMKDGVTGIEVRVRDVYAAREVARRIETELGGFPYRARDWMETNRNLFSALKLEKVVYGIVLCLIVVVAAFNILAALTMVVKEKRRDIAILKSMGAAGSSIARIFIMKGTIIGVTGAAVGSALGLIGCWLLARYQFIELPKDVFLVTTLPVRVEPVNFLVVATVSTVICVLAALAPARRAASLVPVEVIRYE